MTSIKHLPAILLSTSLLLISPAHADDDKVLAVVNGKPLTNQAFNHYVFLRLQQVQHRGELTNEQRQLLFHEYINSELLYQEALKKGIDKTPSVNAELAVQKRTIVINHSLKDHLDAKLTEEAIKQAYQKEYGNGANEYHTRHVLVKSESEANNVLAALKRGEDFKKLAATASIDPSSVDGGDLGWLGSEDMPAPLSAVVATLEKGKYSETPVQSNFGWHIIQLVDKRTISPPAIEDVTRDLAAKLQGEVVAEYIQGLRDNAAIEIK